MMTTLPSGIQTVSSTVSSAVQITFSTFFNGSHVLIGEGFSYHVDWSSIVYRFGDLYTYHNLPVETPEGRSQLGKATLLAVHA